MLCKSFSFLYVLFSRLFQSRDVKGGFPVTNALMVSLCLQDLVCSLGGFLISSSVNVGFEEQLYQL